MLGEVLESVDEEVASTNSEVDAALAEIRERAKKTGKGRPSPTREGKGPLGRSRASVDTPALLSVITGRPGAQAREASFPYPHPSHSTGSCAGRGKSAPLSAAGVLRMDQTPAGKDLAENGLLHATLPSLLAQTAPASSWDPHEEGASPDMVGMSQESGWAQGEESVLSDQPLPVALTIGAREDEINRNIDNQTGKGQAGPNPTTKPHNQTNAATIHEGQSAFQSRC